MKPHHTPSARTDHGIFRRLQNWLAARPAHASLAAPGRLAMEPLEQRHLLSVGPFPTPLTHVEPVGSLIYSGSVESTFDSPGGSDSWTIDLPAGQTATLVVESAEGLQPAVALSDPSGTLATATATAAGETLVLQTVPINEAATYTITVDAQSETTGSYNARLILGASIEAETHNGPTNDTRATAEDLSAAFTDVEAAQRGAVLGSLPIDTIGEDWYQFTLDDGQSSTLVLNSDTLNHEAAQSVTLELYDGDANLLAIGMPTANADRAIDNFIDQTTDTTETTYYARVTGSGGSYRLVVVKDGHLDLETDDWSGESKQDATFYSTILGHLSNNEQKLTAPEPVALENFGIAVSIDGDTAIIGASDYDIDRINPGSAYIFRFDGSRWQRQQKLAASDGAVGNGFGRSVSIDGDTAIVGTIPGDDSSGSAYIFRFDGSQWREEQKLTASGPGAVDRFGGAVSIDSDAVIVGAHGSDDAGIYSGLAYIFRFDGSRWQEEQKLIGSDTTERDSFGRSVSIHGDTTLVGAPGNDDTGSNSGSAYIFRFDGSQWREEQKLTASDGAPEDYFGRAVSIDGDKALVGTGHTDDAGVNSGSAYIFRFDGSRWQEEQELTASDAARADYFGSTVSIYGQTALVSADGNDDAGDHSGSAYIFRFNGTQWQEHQKLTASDAAQYDWFGSSVSTDDRTVIVGAYGSRDAGPYSGSAYVFHAGLADDTYALDVTAGDQLLITTTTPANTLDPALELYDPAGTLVASDDNGAPDGRNSRLAHTAAVSGSYTVKVLAVGDSRGEYVLNISGQTGEGPAFEVVATVPDASEPLTSIPSQITVDFNDSVLLSSLDASDLTISGIPAVAVTIVDHDTAVFDLPSTTLIDWDNVRIAAGAILDLQGTPIEPFGVDLTLPFPPPVNAKAPLGSLIYQSELTGAAIDHWGDTDAFTIDVDPGQTMTVEITNDGWLEATVEIRDSAGNTIAAPPALPYPWHIVTSTARTNPTQPETYTIVASGEFVPQESDYGLELILNGAVEAETFGGHFNDSAATAEDLSASFIDLGTGQRGAVLGRLSTDTLGEDWYRFTLDDGQSSSLTLTAEMADLELELLDAQGNVVAMGMPTGAMQRTIDRFVDPIGDAPESTYYARVIGGENSDGDYSLIVTRDLDFQPQPQDRNSLSGPDITDTGAVLGYLADSTQQRLTADDADDGDLFGGAMAVDGQTAIVGARLDDEAGTSAGAAYILGFDGTEWQQTQKLTASDADEKDWLGHSVAIDGRWAIVGAYGDDDEADDAGAAYLFQFDGQQWQQRQKLTASDAVFSDYFGYDVAIDGNTALVGAYGSSDDGGYSGAAYVFHFDGATWQEQAKLTAQDAGAGDYFGHSVAVENGLAVIGAYRDEDAGTQSGSAYVFRVEGNQWIQQQKLTADDAEANHVFGSAVEIGGGRVIVSAPGDSEAASAAGASYIFDFDGNQWLQQQKLTASDARADAGFGRSVSIDGDTVVVGSDRDDDGGGWHSGSAYVFQFDGTGWVETRKLSADDGVIDDTFGRSVAVSGDTVFVGAPMNDAGAANTGAVYLFEQISAVPRHRYQVDALAGDQLQITTITPGDGPGWPDNTLDPAVRLYDPTGTLVGTDTNGAADGRNARLTHTAAMSGTYTVEIEAEAGTRGEYVLSVAGQTIVLQPFEVEATDPAD
ncbi:MAG: pre-peptidase C-terminal domain-containing protein, partial [Thermoguttaceae bacterium]